MILRRAFIAVIPAKKLLINQPVAFIIRYNGVHALENYTYK